jgi:hypothetical protein
MIFQSQPHASCANEMPENWDHAGSIKFNPGKLFFKSEGFSSDPILTGGSYPPHSFQAAGFIVVQLMEIVNYYRVQT